MTPIAKKIKALANSKYYTTKLEYSTTASKYLCFAAKSAQMLDVLAEVEAYMTQLGIPPEMALISGIIPVFSPRNVEEALSFIKSEVYDDWDNRPETIHELKTLFSLYKNSQRL